MYLTEAEKEDKEIAENWKADTEGILVCAGLFSATVAAFLIESYKKLSPDSGDTTNALLTQISQQLVNISNGTPLTSATAQGSQPFTPTASAVRVNVMWFLSLVLSLSSGLSAALVREWARRYQENRAAARCTTQACSLAIVYLLWLTKIQNGSSYRGNPSAPAPIDLPLLCGSH
ncbi:hypothetical protein EDB92DRAFT_2071937 [Lactarius akahatsu]|uniref:DUF6535 domain-containing protein n=1 Tax=Lactarius akahatsu TaxID=416441 RepID=A0AAD4L8Z8_9AGAM|nr:hypothetical protein EDB92DRAFT_2071937 [Lactarius akahatsu]